MLEIFVEKLAGNLGCPLGNQTIKSGCPASFYGCPGRPDTRFVKPWLLVQRGTYVSYVHIVSLGIGYLRSLLMVS